MEVDEAAQAAVAIEDNVPEEDTANPKGVPIGAVEWDEAST